MVVMRVAHMDTAGARDVAVRVTVSAVACHLQTVPEI
jgi:hypothetical protein